jgi:hypothetical protein
VSYEESIIKRLLVEMSRLEDQSPAKFTSFGLLLAIAEGLEFDDFDSAAVGIDDLEVEYAIEQMLDRGWAEPNQTALELQNQSFRITSKGLLKVASNINDAEIFQKMVGAPSITPDPSIEYKSEFRPSLADSAMGQTSFEPPIIANAPTIDSSSWTGTQFVLVDAYVIAKVLKSAQLLHDAVFALHLPSNSETEDLQKLADALIAVCSMTEPEVSIIDRILASPKFKTYVGLLAIIATIRGAMGI